MRSLAVLSLATCLLVPTMVLAAPRAEAAPATRGRALSPDARGHLAVREVREQLKNWQSPGSKFTVRTALVPFNGNSRNPITGEGPIEVFVTQARPTKPGLIHKLRAMFDPFAKQRYLVHVGNHGSAQILERVSLAPQRRFARFLASRFPLGGLVRDFFKSGRATEGIWTAVGASGAAALSPALSGALFVRAAQVVADGIKSQNVVRTAALDTTVSWARRTYRSTKQWPTLMDTYRAYKGHVDGAQEGARPLSLGDFAEALSMRQL